MLVAGSVIIGRREEGKDVGAAGTAGAEPSVGTAHEAYVDEPDAPPPSVGSPKHGGLRDGAYEDSDEIEMEPHEAGGAEQRR